MLVVVDACDQPQINTAGESDDCSYESRLRTRSLLPARIHGRTSHVHPFRQELDFVKACKSNRTALPSRLCCRTTKLQKFVESRCLSPSACLRHMHGAAFAVSVVALLESWYVCLPYRHLSWFAVRRPSICLLLCSAQRAQHLVSPLYRRGAYANGLPRHGRTLTVEWTFSRLFNVST